MTKQRRPLTESDAAGAGALLLTANAPLAAGSARFVVLVGAVIPLLLAGFFFGFFAGVAGVAKRFPQLI